MATIILLYPLSPVATITISPTASFADNGSRLITLPPTLVFRTVSSISVLTLLICASLHCLASPSPAWTLCQHCAYAANLADKTSAFNHRHVIQAGPSAFQPTSSASQPGCPCALVPETGLFVQVLTIPCLRPTAHFSSSALRFTATATATCQQSHLCTHCPRQLGTSATPTACFC